MSDRSVKRGFEIGAVTRRELLRVGGILLPTYVIAPALMAGRAEAATTGGFDYYISTTGSDSNAGTLASPWSITAINTKQSTYAGKRVGILPGTYDVSGLMFSSNAGHSPALMINGGPSSSTPTYIGTCNSSGTYQAGTATLDAMGSTGLYSGSNSNNGTVIGAAQGYSPGPGTPANWGNWTLDGIIITKWGPWAIQVGSYDGGGGNMPNCIIQNCQFVNGNGSFTNTGINTTHGGCMVLYAYTNCLVHNCLFQNIINTGGNQTHWDAITTYGIGGGSSGLTIEYCSFITASGYYGIEDTGGDTGTTIRYCYFDMTANSGIPNTQAMETGVNGSSGKTGCSFHHNIVRGGSFYDNMGFQTSPTAQTVAFYNNTWDRAGGSGANASGFVRCIEASGSSRLVTSYNNLIYDNGAGSITYGYMACNTDGFALCDYNIYGTAGGFTTYGASGGGLSSSGLSLSSWKNAIGGLEAHSTTNSTNPFANNGANALQYQISSGSPAYQAGRVGGTSGGAVCNIGAWDGTVSQIGCSFAAGATSSIATPDAPVLTVS